MNSFKKNLQCSERNGFTLLEVCVAMIIICVLVTLSSPMYSKAIEQARLDSAAGNLKTVWSAQRAYWLKNHTFADNLLTLENEDLISPALAKTLVTPGCLYVYNIEIADGDSFTAYAERSNSGAWSGRIEINQLGQLIGSISKTDGTTLLPVTLE